MEEILFFYNGVVGDLQKFVHLLSLFGFATSMKINVQMYSIFVHNLDDREIKLIRFVFPYFVVDMEDGFKYLRYHLKPIFYNKSD